MFRSWCKNEPFILTTRNSANIWKLYCKMGILERNHCLWHTNLSDKYLFLWGCDGSTLSFFFFEGNALISNLCFDFPFAIFSFTWQPFEGLGTSAAALCIIWSSYCTYLNFSIYNYIIMWNILSMYTTFFTSSTMQCDFVNQLI